jgi:hypothetical protein
MITDAERTAGAHARTRFRRLWRVVAVVTAVAGAAAATLIVTDPFTVTAGTAAHGNPAPVTLGTVTSGQLSAQVQVNGTLGYGTAHPVVGQASGWYTGLPQPGQVITQGQQLYQVSGTPVILIYGSVPMYRPLSPRTSGADVTELNNDLASMGYGAGKGSDQFTSATSSAVRRLQAHFGLGQTGTLPLGSVLVEPGAIRVSAVTATLGGKAAPGAVALQAGPTARQVTVSLDATQQAEVRPHDKVTITLPNGMSTPGSVSSVGTVASSSPSGSGTSPSGAGSSPAAIVPVEIVPDNPEATGSLDQAPVQVTITSQTVRNALAVPVTALLATTGGGYAVEAVPGHRLVPVTLGIFDDAAGLVQVSGPLHAGERVVEALT